MFYVLQRYVDYETSEVITVLEGPNGLNIDKLREEFYANFDHRTLGEPQYPVYDGPMKDYDRTIGGIFSGALDENGEVVDDASPEYKKWQRRYDKVHREWEKKRKDKIKEFQNKYPGKDTEEMFISYLKAECGLKEVDSEDVWV